MGLANLSLPYYVEVASNLGQRKPLILSLAGLSLSENIDMFRYISGAGKNIAGVELNLSCPNVPGKPQTAYDFNALAITLDKVFEVDLDCPVGVKLPPYFDMVHFEQAADVLKNYPKLRWVTCINSIGNGLYVDPITEETVIRPKNGFGGIGGSIIKPTALANVRMFRQLLPDKIDVVGCGGIIKGMDIFEHILCGASAVQLGSVLQENGVKVIPRLYDELTNVMTLKNYPSLSHFRNKLKVAPEEPRSNKDPALAF